MERLTRWNGKKWVLPQGAWREIAERLAAYENTGLEPEQVEKLKSEKTWREIDAAADSSNRHRFDLLTASVIVHDPQGNVPYVDPTTCNAYLYAEEIEANADNPEVIREHGVNHLVIAVYRDHWHIAQVSGYPPDRGTFVKVY